MKIRYIAPVFVVLALMLGFTQSADAAQDAKVGYVNLSLIFDSYEKTKSFDEDLQKEAESKRAERETLVNAVKKTRDELELLSPENRASKQEEIDQMVQELQAFDRDSRLTLRQKRDKMIREILEEIDTVVQDYGKKNGYDYIFNDRVLLFKKEQNDLSQDIVKLLNG